jgi:DNA-binding winged helix-turn-helix (wHTH) protein
VQVTTSFGRFTLDDGARQVYRNGDPIHLSPKAFDLLTLLVHRRPQAISKSDILDALWRDTFVSEGNLAVLVKEIRDALGDNAQRPTFIRTVQRFGYAFSGIASAGQAREAAPCSLTWGTQRATLLMGENILGRDPAANVSIDMVGVSRRHAMIAIVGDDITLTDLGSKNGTFANGERVSAPVPLADDVEIRLGPVPIRFRRLAHGASTQTFDASRISRSST